MANFVELLQSLENEVINLISNLESKLAPFVGAPSLGSINQQQYKNLGDVGSNNKKMGLEPKWKGLRGVWRWLWKGKSKDNPDYAHLYKNENRISLEQYLEEKRLINKFADNILIEVFGASLYQENASIGAVSNILFQFKNDFRSIIMKYRALMLKANKADPKSEPVVDPKADPKSDESNQKGNRSYSLKAQQWFEDAIEAKEKTPENLRPSKEWLNKNGVIKAARVPWVIAWMSLRPHANPLDVDSIKNELNRPEILNGAVKSVLPSIAKKGLIHYMRQWFVSNEENEEAINDQFNKLIEKVSGHGAIVSNPVQTASAGKSEPKEKVKPSVGSKSEEKKQKTREMQHQDRKETDRKETDRKETDRKETDRKETDTEETEKNKFSKLYDGLTKAEAMEDDPEFKNNVELIGKEKAIEKYNKKEIIEKVEKKLIRPIFKSIEKDSDKENFASWWGDLENKITNNERYTTGALIAFINNALAGEIIKNAEVSTKEKKINLSKVMEILDKI